MIGVIPAAGYGTRLYELGKEYPKSVLPYKEKPLLVWNVEWMRAQGCTDIRVVVSHQADKIREIAELYDLGITITTPANMGGLSQSILSGIEVAPASESVLIVLGDILVDDWQIDYSSNWVSTFAVTDWSRWCLIDPSTGTFYDKPTEKPPTNQALSGVYHFTDCNELTTALREQISEGTTIAGELQFSSAMEKVTGCIETRNLRVKDFGTLANYLENRGLRNSRSFNTVTLSKHTVRKSSTQRSKIIAEYNWYRNLPNSLVTHTPRVLGADLTAKHEASYELERIYLPTLRELYLFFDRSEETWNRILQACIELHFTFSQYKSTESPKEAMWEKVQSRLKHEPRLPEIVRNFLADFRKSLDEFETESQLMHGDFCFSNLFYDDAKGSVVMIDPRGELYGSRYYDWAKLRHSALYDYDFTDAELYTVHEGAPQLFNKGTEGIAELFREKEARLFTESERSHLELLTASLFLSMVPLHSHNPTNQRAFYEKFKEIYEGWQGNSAARC